MEEYRKRQAEKYAAYKHAEDQKRLAIRDKYFSPVQMMLDSIKNLPVDDEYLSDLEVLLSNFEVITEGNEYLEEIKTLVMETVLDIIQKFSYLFASFEQQQIVKRVHKRINAILKSLGLDPVECEIEMDTSGDAEYAASLQ